MTTKPVPTGVVPAASAAGELENLQAKLREALEWRQATSDVLNAISDSDFDLQPMFDRMLAEAARITRADFGNLYLGEFTGDVPTGGPVVASYNVPASVAEANRQFAEGIAQALGRGVPPSELARRSLGVRVYVENRTVHLPDVEADPDLWNEVYRELGVHAVLGVPMRRKGRFWGAITLFKIAPGPFDGPAIRLVESFADQAVIAIENVRLFNEAQAALERQTATASVLNAISSTAFDLPRVLETVIAHATRLAGAENGFLYQAEGDLLRMSATYGPKAEVMRAWQADHPIRGDYVGSSTGRAFTYGRTVHIPDVPADPGYTYADAQRLGGFKTLLSVPLLRDGVALGVISMWRTKAVPFSGEQIALVETFADQAVIAIENARLFAEIQDTSRQLEAASRHKSEFLANMSHELRTPLNAIIGFADVLDQRMYGDLNEQQREYTRDIASSGRHLLDLVNEILDLSKIEAGRMDLELSEFTLADTVYAAVSFVRERAAHHGIQLSSSVPNDLGTVFADERKVRQVLLNLLSNAVKFTPDGGRVAIAARQAEEEVQISVLDTGIGIAPEDQARVFDEFRQVGTRSDRSREGTGLGLTLAKRFVELHGGRMWLESELGKGTTFFFAIPTHHGAPDGGPEQRTVS